MNRDNPADIDILREIGWKYWDPLDLKHFLNNDLIVPPVDEYDFYLLQVVEKLYSGITTNDAAKYLRSVVDNRMNVDPADYDPESCFITVSKISEYLETLD